MVHKDRSGKQTRKAYGGAGGRWVGETMVSCLTGSLEMALSGGRAGGDWS